MNVNKIQSNSNYNTNFKGFKFNTPFAEMVFEMKVNKYSDDIKKSIMNYVKEAEKEPVDIILNATFAKSTNREHILVADFSNSNDFIVERGRLSNCETLNQFINRCAAKAGYKPLEIPKTDAPKKA